MTYSTCRPDSARPRNGAMRPREFARFAPAASLKVAALVLALGLFAPGLFAPLGIENSAAQGAGPFAGMAGNWSGTGAITLASGSHERIRCRAVYEAPGGKTLALRLRCASDSYNFDLVSNLTHQGDAISGTWSEVSRNVSGSVSGRAAGGTIQAVVTSAVFSANLTMTTRGTKQSVSIRSQGTEFSEAAITLNKT
jgi:hypothetical protein